APSLVSQSSNNGTSSINYRNEPIPLRIQNQTGDAGDLSYAYASIDRKGYSYPKDLQGKGPTAALSSDVDPDDPYTPLMRAYAGDNVQLRILSGAHLQAKYFSLHGPKWHPEPSFLDSGYRSTQVVSLSEHFELLFKSPQVAKGAPQADFLYED